MGQLLIGVVLLVGIHLVVVRGASGKDPIRAAGIAYRTEIAGPLGTLPPSHDLLGKALWVLCGAALATSVVLTVASARFAGLASATMLGTYLLILLREDRWLKADQGFKRTIAQAQDQRERERESENNEDSPDEPTGDAEPS